jgi:hypothetical protein
MTKQLLLCFLLSLGLCGIARGQISVGAKTGVNINQFSQPGTTFGAQFGAYAAYPVNAFITVKVEPHYSQEGGGRPDYNWDLSDVGDYFQTIYFINPSVRFHNLQIPVLAEITLPELTDQSVVPVLIVGASYGFALTAMEQHTKRFEVSSDGYLVGDEFVDFPQLDVSYEHENVTDRYARSQWSLWTGAGMRFNTGERKFQFDVRYRHGLNNLNNLQYFSPGNNSQTAGIPGTGGRLISSSISFNFSMSIFNF